MSRVGKSPVALPKGVETTISADQITVKGPLGTLSLALVSSIKVVKEGEELKVQAANDSR
jgi:large subunit ribosomal protein L6